MPRRPCAAASAWREDGGLAWRENVSQRQVESASLELARRSASIVPCSACCIARACAGVGPRTTSRSCDAAAATASRLAACSSCDASRLASTPRPAPASASALRPTASSVARLAAASASTPASRCASASLLDRCSAWLG